MGGARIPPRRHRLGAGSLFRDHMSIKCVSPVDGRVYAERTAATPAQIDQALQRARAALLEFSAEALDDGGALGERHLAPPSSSASALNSSSAARGSPRSSADD